MCLHLFDCITCSLQFELPNSLFFGQLSQIHPLSRAMNWSTPYCKGYVSGFWMNSADGSWTKKKRDWLTDTGYLVSTNFRDQITSCCFWCTVLPDARYCCRSWDWPGGGITLGRSSADGGQLLHRRVKYVASLSANILIGLWHVWCDLKVMVLLQNSLKVWGGFH